MKTFYKSLLFTTALAYSFVGFGQTPIVTVSRPLVLNEIHMCGELDFVIVGGNIEYAGCNGTVCLQQFLVASLSG